MGSPFTQHAGEFIHYHVELMMTCVSRDESCGQEALTKELVCVRVVEMFYTKQIHKSPFYKHTLLHARPGLDRDSFGVL